MTYAAMPPSPWVPEAAFTSAAAFCPRLLDWLPKCELRASFVNKGRMGGYNADIPVWIVTHPWTGLLGAAEALHNEEVF